MRIDTNDHALGAHQLRGLHDLAEAYAVYYSDQGSKVGTRLRTRDAATADWFDANVDKGHSIQKEAGGGAGGGAGGVARAVGPVDTDVTARGVVME